MQKPLCKLILQTFLTLALLIYPLSLSAQNSFSVSLDVDSSVGDQAVISANVSADQVVAIQIFATDIQNANGLAARFEYDASQVTYDGFDVGNVLPNAQALPEHGTGFIEIGIASLGGQATANSGLVGTIRFRTTAAFSGTAIWLVRAELSRGGQFETITLNTRIELQFQAVSPDFNGDDVVNFADFLAFGNQFGARQGDGRYDAKYDLDSDGAIGFGDFLIFGRSFGQEVSTPGGGGGGEETQITIPDANLHAVIANSLGKANDASITRADMATMTSLTALKKDIRDLTGLEFATGLTSLDLSQNFISDITPLSGLTDLTSLDLSYNTITDISPLSGLTNLTRLRLHDNFFSDISPLSGLTNLTSLSLYDAAAITDRSVLSRLSNLSEIDIPDANLRAVIQIAMGKTSDDPVTSFEMAFLSEFVARDSNISDLIGLELAINLTKLNLRGNSISDIAPLSGLTNLTELDLTGNDISDIAPLSSLTNLTVLNLYSNSISNIAPLSGLTNLTVLWLPYNSISDIVSLSGLTNLRSLRLHSNSISDIAPLSRLTNLMWLRLSNNSISDITPLSGLTNLTYLDLSRNSITDFSPLVANMGLGAGDRVDVRNNPLSATSINTHIPALQSRGVEISFDPTPVSNDPTPVNIPDTNLRTVITDSLGKASGATITRGDMSTVTRLDARNANISDLTGLDFATRLKRLDLYGNSISDLLPLSDLTNLTYLNLSRNSISDLSPLITNTGLGEGDRVGVTDNPLSATSINTHIPTLQSRGVEISFDPTPVSNDPTPVNIPDTNLRAVIADSLDKAIGATITRGDMSTLTRLDARNANISDLTGLEFATRLKSLDLGTEWVSGEGNVNSNHISDFSPLSGLTNLTNLDLSRTGISDVSVLSGLTSLTRLHLDNNSISDISPLSSLTNLRSLWLPANSISDISPLANLTEMWQLSISSNSISDITPLSGLTNLRSLYLSSNSISNASVLSGLTNLRSLNLSSTGISDLSVLSSLTNLTWLSLSSNSISNITPLSSLTNLTSLTLWNNSITDISTLSALTNLEWLNLSRNSISNITSLSGLTSLERLYLDSNSISNIAPLVANTGLGEGDRVDVRNNPLSATSINTHIPALQNRGVDVRFSASKPGVEETEPRMPYPENEDIVNGGRP